MAVLEGFLCRKCGEKMLDGSNEQCWSCGEPYDDFERGVAKAHREAMSAFIQEQNTPPMQFIYRLAAIAKVCSILQGPQRTVEEVRRVFRAGKE